MQPEQADCNRRLPKYALSSLQPASKSLLPGYSTESEHKSEIMATERPSRPDTTSYVTEPVGTGAVVNNRASQVDASNAYPSYYPPSRTSHVSSKVGAGLGFACVAIIIGAVLVWKRNSKISTYTNTASNVRMGSTRRNEQKEPRRRRGSSNKRNIGTIGSGRAHKERKENRTIYDSDSSIDSAFEINKRMKIYPTKSDPDFAFEMSRRMKIDPVNSDSDSESSYASVTPQRNRVQNP